MSLVLRESAAYDVLTSLTRLQVSIFGGAMKSCKGFEDELKTQVQSELSERMKFILISKSISDAVPDDRGDGQNHVRGRKVFRMISVEQSEMLLIDWMAINQILGHEAFSKMKINRVKSKH
jgi:hypothetical protein